MHPSRFGLSVPRALRVFRGDFFTRVGPSVPERLRGDFFSLRWVYLCPRYLGTIFLPKWDLLCRSYGRPFFTSVGSSVS